MRKPFYFAQKQCWYVRDSRGKAIRLNPDEKEAYRIWQQIVETASDLSHPAVTFKAIVCAWLEEHESQISQGRFTTVSNWLVAFADSLIGQASQVKNIKPSTVSSWLQKQDWTSGWTERSALSSIKRVMKWAHNEGLIKKNQLANMKLKEPKYRTRIISPSEHALMIYSTRKRPGGKQFALLLIASHCGARPQQLRMVKPANIHQSGSAWIFQQHKTVEKTNKPLVVYLSPCLQTLTKILTAHRNTDQPLFMQENGRPWAKDTVSKRFARMRERIGLSDEVVIYSYRHTFATDALIAEIPIATVSTLLGHTDTRMVSRVYGHLDQVSGHLIEATARANQKRLGS